VITQSVAIAISVVLFVLTIVAFWFFTFRGDYDEWIALGIPVLILLLAGGSLFWSLNDNYYGVKSGVVIEQQFTPAHQNPPTIISSGKSTVIMPGAWVPDDWSIQIKSNSGKTGWIHFSNNVFLNYPKGSPYP
jgi:hypothetical protein